MTDFINCPPHYIEGRKLETIDVIEDWKLGFHLGNAIKYISRAGRKTHNPVEDIEKAVWYLNRFCDDYEAGVDHLEREPECECDPITGVGCEGCCDEDEVPFSFDGPDKGIPSSVLFGSDEDDHSFYDPARQIDWFNDLGETPVWPAGVAPMATTYEDVIEFHSPPKPKPAKSSPDVITFGTEEFHNVDKFRGSSKKAREKDNAPSEFEPD